MQPLLVLELETECNCATCQCRRTLWEDTVAAVAERHHLDHAEAVLHVRTYAPTPPRMVQ